MQNINKCMDKIKTTTQHISNELDIFPSEIQTPHFYILPKIHKSPDESLTLHYPGRPIVAACNSPTENISKYIYYILKPHMLNLPSYVKNSVDFIN